ncbi:MAG: hypothetical protein GXO26_05680 [Crenarchaeota archaeon]|nr:hypothetical protein [Thermoproteota archaeon]
MKKGTIADSWLCNVKISLESDKDIVDMLYRSLKPLEKELRFHRGRSKIIIEDSSLILEGDAKDLTSLRSVLNGLLKCLYLSYMVIAEDLRVNK